MLFLCFFILYSDEYSNILEKLFGIVVFVLNFLWEEGGEITEEQKFVLIFFVRCAKISTEITRETNCVK